MGANESRGSGVISDSVSVGEGTKFGHFVVIGANVSIGSNCIIGHHVIIHDDTIIEDHVSIDDHAVLGKKPYRAAMSTLPERHHLNGCHVAMWSHIGTGAILYKGCALGQKVFVADLATVRENVTIGERTIIGRGVAIESDSKIGARCKIETNAYITACSTIEDDCFIAPCVATSNDDALGRGEAGQSSYKGVVLKRGGRIGVHATILPGRIIDEDAIVAAGAVLTCNTQPRKVYIGVPARETRKVSEKELLKK